MKIFFRFAVTLALLVIAVSAIHIAHSLDRIAHEHSRFNNFIDAIRSEIPMSLLGN